MELGYVLSSVRRYWWALALCVLIGTVSALGLKQGRPVLYESRALLSLSPPINFTGAAYLPDRYVAGQMTVLGSEAVATAVAAQVGHGITPQSLPRELKIRQSPNSDIVELIVARSDPKSARDIVGAYVDVYFKDLRAQIDESQKATIASLDRQLSALQDQLAKVDSAIATALAVYITPPRQGSVASALPTVDQVAPARGLDQGWTRTS